MLCDICNLTFESWNKRRCFYCEKLACDNCITNTEWDEYVCNNCIKFIPLKTQFESFLKDRVDYDFAIEKHKFLGHNNQRVLKFNKVTSVDDVNPSLQFVCKCSVIEDKIFKIKKIQFTSNPLNFNDNDLKNMDLDVYENEQNNFFIKHSKLCHGQFKSFNKYKWFRMEGMYSAEIKLFQLWNCKQCCTEIICLYFDCLVDRKYK